MEARLTGRSLLCTTLVQCLWSLLLASLFSVCYAQARTNDRAAHKFDEYKISQGDGVEEEKRLARFARQLKLEPQTTGYVIAYGPRVLDYFGSSYWYIPENRLQATKVRLVDTYGVKESRLSLKDGGVREETTLELWVLPEGATPPAPRPEFKSGEIVKCYPVRIDEYSLYVLRRETPLKFTVNFSLGKPQQPVTFQWNVNAGRIIAGQGTDSIRVEINDAAIEKVSATVEVKGLSAECNEKSSATTIVGVAPYKLFEYEDQYSEDLKFHLDYLAIVLRENPELQSHIIVYGARRGRRSYLPLRSDAARNYLTNLQAVSPERFTIAVGGYREHEMFEIWVLPRGMSPPPATPTVDEKFVRFIDQPKITRKRNRR